MTFIIPLIYNLNCIWIRFHRDHSFWFFIWDIIANSAININQKFFISSGNKGDANFPSLSICFLNFNLLFSAMRLKINNSQKFILLPLDSCRYFDRHEGFRLELEHPVQDWNLDLDQN